MNAPFIFSFCIVISSLAASCQSQEPVTINVVFKPDQTYHFIEVEERTDKGESRGMEDFSSDEVPNPATWKTKTTINKVIHTGAFNSDSIFPVTVHHHRTREIRGKGIYKEGTYQDSVIALGTGSDGSLKIDSIQLLPLNDFMTRDASKANIRETLFGYNNASGLFKINNRKLRPGETFINTITNISEKGEKQVDSMTFTLLRVDKNIAVLSFTLNTKFDFKSPHLVKHSELHTTGDIKVDLDKQMIVQRNQEDKFFDLEKMPSLKSEIESNVSKNISETYIE